MPVKRRGKWYGRKSVDGKRKEKQFPTKKDALAWELMMQSALSTQKEDGIVLSVFLGNYLTSCETRGQSEKHVKEKERAYTTFMKNTKTGLTPVTDITYDLVERALNHIAKTVSPHRANVHRKLLVAAWNWGIKAHDLPPKNPFSVDSYKVDKTEKYIPPIDDFWRLVDSVQPHEQRLLLTFLYTGSRRNEILSLKWKDVDFNKNIVWLETRKRRGGGVHRDAVPMVDALKEALQEQRLETGLQGFVFINPATSQPYSPFTKLMNGWCSEAQIKPFNFHAIRHLSASILADKGYSLPDIQKLLRHKAVTTTAHYLHSLGMTSLDLEGAFDRPVKKQKVNEMVNRTEKRVNEIAYD